MLATVLALTLVTVLALTLATVLALTLVSMYAVPPLEPFSVQLAWHSCYSTASCLAELT